MSYDPDIHHRRSIRLKEYDYSQAGMYFVTICVNDVGADLRVRPNKTGEHTGSPLRPHLFGKIKNGEMLLNDAGKMVDKWRGELSHKFPGIVVETYIIMPNHFHAIIVNNGGNDVGADLCVCPNELGDPVGADLCVRPNKTGEHTGSPLRTVVQWFKTMTTNEYIHGVKTLGWQPFKEKLWQRNYWEHVIRNAESHQRIMDYIINNPVNWRIDKFYTE